MAARPGVPGITNRPHSFIMSARTMRSRIASTADNRRAVRLESRAADRTAKLPSATGTRSAAEEYGYVTAAPHDPDIVYGGKLTRYDRRTHQGQNILPKPFRSDEFRMVRTEPVIFSPTQPKPAFLRDQHSVADDRWRAELAGDQPRPEPQDLSKSRPVSANFVTSPPRNRGSVV